MMKHVSGNDVCLEEAMCTAVVPLKRGPSRNNPRADALKLPYLRECVVMCIEEIGLLRVSHSDE